MFDRRPELHVVFVPGEGVDPDKAIELGAAWLREQPGRGLVLLHAKKMYRNNPRLPALTSGALVETLDTVWRSGWAGGPILAPWPSEEVLGSLSDQLAAKATSVCVIEWGVKAFRRAWLRAHGAQNLVSGASYGGPSNELLSPTVRVAMTHLSLAVNHNNALVQGYEKSYAVRTLQELHRAGHHIDVDNLCAWALANGFSQVVGSSRVDLQACKLEYSIVSPK